MDGLLTTVQQYVSTETLIWLTALSFVFFIGTLIAIPFILVRLSADYFDVRVPRPWMQHHHPVLRIVGHIVKRWVPKVGWPSRSSWRNRFGRIGIVGLLRW